VLLGDGSEREIWKEMGEMIMGNWDWKEFRARVDTPFLIWQVLLPIRRIKAPIQGLLNPIRQVVPLTLHICSYPPYCAHLHPPSLFLCHNRWTQSWVISLYLSMQWLWVNTEFSIHWVQHPPKIDWLPIILTITCWPRDVASASGVPPHKIDPH